MPAGLGKSPAEQIENLAGVLDGYMGAGGFHLNVNVLDRALLEDAMEHPQHHGGSRAELEAELADEGDPEIGYYHSYEITGAVNGPGVRFTLFLFRLPVALPVLPEPSHVDVAQRKGRHRRANGR